jgi:hypothetical protein
MRTFELRVYKLRTKEAWEEKAERTHWGTALYMMTLPCFFFGGRNLNSFQGVVYGGIYDGSPKCRCNYRRWIDGWM